MVFLVFRALILSEVGADGNIYRDNLIMKYSTKVEYVLSTRP